MDVPFNLVSNSPLIQEALDFVAASGGRARTSQIAEEIFRLSQVSEELSHALISDLIENDRRFIIEDGSLLIRDQDPEVGVLTEIEFIVLDVEAVAPKSGAVRIIELAAYRVRSGKIVDEFQTLINPGISLSPFIKQLTGLSNEMIAAAPAFAAIAEHWLRFAGNGVLVAHNADFDVPLPNEEIARIYPGKRMANTELCTVKLARRLLRNPAGHNLDALAEHLGFAIDERHRAASDARATVRILLHLLDVLDAHGVRTLAAARTFQAKVSATPAVGAPLALDV
jgi:DNA polymerase III epsilon subunit family exonuclease